MDYQLTLPLLVFLLVPLLLNLKVPPKSWNCLSHKITAKTAKTKPHCPQKNSTNNVNPKNINISVLNGSIVPGFFVPFFWYWGLEISSSAVVIVNEKEFSHIILRLFKWVHIDTQKKHCHNLKYNSKNKQSILQSVTIPKKSIEKSLIQNGKGKDFSRQSDQAHVPFLAATLLGSFPWHLHFFSFNLKGKKKKERERGMKLL